MTKPTRNRSPQQTSRKRNMAEPVIDAELADAQAALTDLGEDDADQQQDEAELDVLEDEGADEADGNEPDEKKGFFFR